MNKPVGNSIVIKEININIIRNALKIQRKSTKQRLSELTGLSTVTIGSILQQLELNNEVYQDDLIPSNGGRPAHSFCFNAESSHVIVIYVHQNLGKDMVYSKVINLFGKCIYEKSIFLDEIYLNSFEIFIDDLLKKYTTIKAIGFGLPGSEYDGIVYINDYKNLNSTKFTQYYKNKYNIPVIFENDVNLAVMGYCHLNSIMSDETVIYIYFPKKHPPGAGIYINGNLYKGINNFAGEIKNLPLEIDWDNMEYSYFDDICNVISNFIISFVCILNPNKIVLYGDFLTDAHLDSIIFRCNEKLDFIVLPKLFISKDFDFDFQTGIALCTLELIMPRNVFEK